MSLANSINLRKTTEYPFYSEARVIPHLYGNLKVNAFQYQANSKMFLIASHPIQQVLNVWVEGKLYKNWQLHNTADSLNKSVALLELDKPASNVVVELKGKMKASGELIENPIDVIEDILKLAGINLVSSRFSSLRSLCSDISIHYVLQDDKATVRAIIESISKSIGIAFSSGLMSLGCLYPSNYTTSYKTLTSNRIKNLQATINDVDYYNKLIFDYNSDYSSNNSQNSITLKATSDEAERTLNFSAPEIVSNNSAMSVATRILQYHARRKYSVTFETDDTNILPTDIISISHPLFSATKSYIAFVKNAQTDLLSRTNRITAEIVLEDAPTIKLLGQSKVYVGTASEISYTYQNGILEISVFSIEKKPLKNAVVEILKKEVKTDANGIAKFTLPSGTYNVKISATGYNTQISEITI